MTSVVTNLDDINTEEENPLDQKWKFIIHSQKKLRYKWGEVIIKWKPWQEKDAKDRWIFIYAFLDYKKKNSIV